MITNLVLVALAVVAVVFLKKRGVPLPIGPVVNPSPIVDNPALDALLQAILSKLLDNKPLLEWETLLAGHFAEDLIGIVPGLARILQTHGLVPVPKPVPAKPA